MLHSSTWYDTHIVHWDSLFGVSRMKKRFANTVGCSDFSTEFHLWPSSCIYFTRHVTAHTLFVSTDRARSIIFPSAKPLSSCCASFLTASQRHTPTRVGGWDPVLGEIPALNRKWMSPQSSWRAEICLSPSSENPLLQKKKKINSWGWGGGLLSTCAEE